MKHFWAQVCVEADTAFGNSEFGDYLLSIGTKFRPTPVHFRHKNAIQSKHRVIRDIYLRLRAADPDADSTLQALQTIRMLNNLYGNAGDSAHKLVKGFTLPAVPLYPFSLPLEILEAHDVLVAKHKLNAILRSKAAVDKQVKKGDLVQMYVKYSNVGNGSFQNQY